MDRIRILLDTDPGSDIDDALAISYLLKQPQCDLMGITTVTGDVGKRAAIVELLCSTGGKPKVPIFAGRRDVLAHGPGQPNVPHFEAVQNLVHHHDYKPDQAVDFLRKTIRSRPHEIVLATIGPMSNIAILFALDPEIPSLLKGLVSMAGAFGLNDGKEWNCICDPTATAIVAKSARPQHQWYGLDVTTQVNEPADQVRANYRGPLLELVRSMAEVFLRNSSHITYHDPLAVVSIFEPRICDRVRGTVSVDPIDGKTSFRPGEGTDQVALKVDSAQFFEHFYEVVRS